MSNSFLNCVADICGVELATLLTECKYTVFGNHTAVIEGHRGIAEYSSNGISFAVNKSFLHIRGANLRIKCLEKNFAVVVGEIDSVEVRREK